MADLKGWRARGAGYWLIPIDWVATSLFCTVMLHHATPECLPCVFILHISSCELEILIQVNNLYPKHYIQPYIIVVAKTKATKPYVLVLLP